ncbi:MAG: serine/threonine protein kinase, partial [Planctomycetes bacterium]|nr:serine/threonine protein kinase [Planctomycetota bacterium]
MDEKSPFPLKPQQLLRLLAIGKEEDAGPPPPVEDSQPATGTDGAPERLPPWIGRYRVVEILGEGGMGIVYRARQEYPIERTVAVKVIKPGMDSKEVMARFETERQALAMLDHPNIAQVFDAGTTEAGWPYFAMEYVQGIPITDYCDRYKLGTQERLRLFIPLCQAIQHAHHKGIVHRDIKPSNALVVLDDQTPIPKIIDFGVAKALNQRLTERTLFTEQGQLIGTPEYMSPEQAGLTGLDVDTRTDIYSLGVLLYELLTGCPPFDPQDLRSKGYAEMQRIICEQDPVKPSTKLTTLGGKLEDIAKHRSATVEQLRKSVRGDL